MDFSMMGFNGFSSNKQKWCESLSTHTFIEQKKTSNPDSATDSNNASKLSNDFSLKEQNMLSFSTLNSENNKTLQTEAFPFFQHPDSSYSKNAGYTGNNGRMCYITGAKWPFTTSQWIELEQQALIFKYIYANEPIPSHLLIPIKTALLSPSFCTFPSRLLAPNAYGWGPFHLGFPNNGDPEPGRCRRTDGKKWRCSKDAVIDHKYCERHMNRGRHRSRKPVEAAISGNNSTTSNKTKSPSSSTALSNPLSTPVISRNMTGLDFLTPTISLNSNNNTFPIAEDQEYPESAPGGFPFLTTDHSWLNSTLLWPKIQTQPENTQLSISIPSGEKFTLSPLRLSREIDPLEMGLRHGTQPNLDLDLEPIGWDTSIGGPLGEALKTTSNSNNSVEHEKNLSALNLLSPTGVLRRTPLGSANSSAGSSPRADVLENGRMFWEKISEF